MNGAADATTPLTPVQGQRRGAHQGSVPVGDRSRFEGARSGVGVVVVELGQQRLDLLIAPAACDPLLRPLGWPGVSERSRLERSVRVFRSHRTRGGTSNRRPPKRKSQPVPKECYWKGRHFPTGMLPGAHDDERKCQ